MIKNDNTYDLLKKVCTVVLPAVITLWLALGDIWSFPLVTEIGATLGAVNVFLGTLLGISNAKWTATMENDWYEEEGDE